MIKKFEEFISEGLWSNTFDRARTGKVRIGDKVRSKEELREIIEERLKLDEDADFSDLDVSEVTDMSYLFDRLSPRNINISNWDVSNVKNMKCMFMNCRKFNADLSKWDVSNVENMWNMFDTCESFNSDLSKWNVSKVKDMCGMFHFCTKLNCDLSNWDVSNVKRFGDLFWNCESLDTDLSKWNVSKARVNSKRVRFKFNNMFFNCKNLQIPSWYKLDINEGLWSGTFDRARTGETRLENGRKYKTSLGIEVETTCPSNEDVEEVIEFILNSDDDDYRLYYGFESGDLIVGSDGRDDVYISYPDFGNIEEEFEDLSEEDYDAITTCIGTAIKENIGKYANIIVSSSGYGFGVLLDERYMEEIGEDDGWVAYKKLLGDWVKDRNNHKTNTGFDLGEWSDWRILLNYEAVKNFPEIHKDVKECLNKWRDEYNEDEEEE